MNCLKPQHSLAGTVTLAWIRAECLLKDSRICYFGLDIVDYFL